MIKKAIKGLLIGYSVFYVVLILTVPREELWYLIEHKLYEFGVVVDGEELNNGLVELNVENGSIHFEALKVGDFEKKSLLLTLFYNQFSLKNLKFSEDMANLGKFKIDELYVTHSLIYPNSVSLQGKGNFGDLKGKFDLFEKRLDLLVHPSKELKRERSIMKHLKKHEEGYIYNAKF
jgi:hypothetical protein